MISNLKRTLTPNYYVQKKTNDCTFDKYLAFSREKKPMILLFECFFVKNPHNSTHILACPIYIVCDWNVSGELFSHIIPIKT